MKALAAKKGVTPAQLCLAWIRSYSNTGSCGTIVPIPGATKAVRIRENSIPVELTAEEKQEIEALLDTIEVVGHRQIEGADQFINT